MPDDTEELVAVEDLLPGDLVDLDGDPYADPKHDNLAFQCEYEVVWKVVRETPACTAVYFNFDAVGFPVGHKLKRAGHDDDFEADDL